jgi:hypothetical protein
LRRTRFFAEVRMMVDNEILIMAVFLSAGLLAYVIIPGMLVIWDRVLDHMEYGGTGGADKKQ